MGLHYGIDIPDTEWMVGEAEVTARTILFCSFTIAGTRFLFFKPESHGLGSGTADMVSHGIDYILTRPAVAKRLGKSTHEVYRKERIPDDWKVHLWPLTLL